MINEELFKALLRRTITERLDASDDETAFLLRHIQAVRAKVFEVITPALLARTFVPKATDIPSDAPSYEYEVVESLGRAKHASYRADDHPRADVAVRSVTGAVVPITATYGWDFNELRTAARNGRDLPARKALAARNIIERGIDECLAYGLIRDGEQGADGTPSRNGLVNNQDVAGNASGRILPGSYWDDTTPDSEKMLADLNALAKACGNDTKQNFESDTIILPKTHYDMANQTPFGAVMADKGTSVMQVFRNNNPHIKMVAGWHLLDDVKSNVGGDDKPRAICYAKDPTILEGVIPQEFEEIGMQPKLYELIFPCHARAGGTKIYYPDAVRYMDFATS